MICFYITCKCICIMIYYIHVYMTSQQFKGMSLVLKGEAKFLATTEETIHKAGMFHPQGQRLAWLIFLPKKELNLRQLVCFLRTFWTVVYFSDQSMPVFFWFWAVGPSATSYGWILLSRCITSTWSARCMGLESQGMSLRRHGLGTVTRVVYCRWFMTVWFIRCYCFILAALKKQGPDPTSGTNKKRRFVGSLVDLTAYQMHHSCEACGCMDHELCWSWLGPQMPFWLGVVVQKS